MESTFHGSDTRLMFDRLLQEEPEMLVDAGSAALLGRRLWRRRRARSAVAGLGVVALLAVALAAIQGGGDGSTTARADVASPDWQFTSAEGVPAAVSGQPADSAIAQLIIPAIQANSPAGWTFEFGEGYDDAAVEGTADDGAGAGRLLVFVSQEPGSTTLRPCDDPDFVQGAECSETTLPDGSILSVRGLVDFDGIRYLNVVLTHPDGSGVGAESGNFTIPATPPTPVDVDEADDSLGTVRRPELLVGRADPTYTADQLVDVVLAVDEAAT